MGKRRADLRAVTEDLFHWQGALWKQLRESLALDILHGDKHFAGVLPYFVNRADVWMIQSGSGARLLLETFMDLFCVGHGFRKKLERYGSMKRGVFRSIDSAHAAAAKRSENTVVRNKLGWHG